jgi:putative salt-induced outer membrane protein YdiY
MKKNELFSSLNQTFTYFSYSIVSTINSIVMKLEKIIFVLILVFSFLNSKAQQDTVYTLNGDVLVGELKSMRLNVLTFDTKYADSEFKIDWSEVGGIIVNSKLLIFTDDGSRYTGTMNVLKGQPRLTRIVSSGTSITMTLEDVVEIIAIKKNFTQRINIWLDAGYSFTKANNSQQLSIDGRILYQAVKWSFNGNFSKVGTYQDNVDETSRTEGGGTYTITVWGKSFAFGGLEFLKNSEQLLDLRTTSKLGVGYYFFRTNHWYLGAAAGLANSRENYGGDEPIKSTSFEGLGILELNAYDIGDLSLSSKVSVYPSLTNKGRVRINSDLSAKYDLPFDFYVKVSFNHNFDNEPLIDVSKTDFVFKTSIGWEWD